MAAIISLLGLTIAAWPHDDVDRFRLAGRRFAIAHRYMVPGLDHPWYKVWSQTEEEDREVLVTVPGAEVVASVPTYREWEGRYHADILIRIEVVLPSRLRLDPNRWFGDMWAGTGRFIGRRVEADSLPGLFRVFGQYDYPKAWDVIRANPETAPMPLEVFPTSVARCRTWPTPITPEGVLTACNTMLQVDNVRAHFEVTYQNLAHIDEIKSFLVNLLGGWLVDGVHGPVIK
jgi:hypothetical protein